MTYEEKVNEINEKYERLKKIEQLTAKRRGQKTTLAGIGLKIQMMQELFMANLEENDRLQAVAKVNPETFTTEELLELAAEEYSLICELSGEPRENHYPEKLAVEEFEDRFRLEPNNLKLRQDLLNWLNPKLLFPSSQAES